MDSRRSSVDSRRSSVASVTSVAHLITGFLSTDHHVSVDEHTSSSMPDQGKFSSSFEYNNDDSTDRKRESTDHSISDSHNHVRFLPSIPEQPLSGSIQPESLKMRADL